MPSLVVAMADASADEDAHTNTLSKLLLCANFRESQQLGCILREAGLHAACLHCISWRHTLLHASVSQNPVQLVPGAHPPTLACV